MKRIQYACLLQTVRFETKTELETFQFYLKKKNRKYEIESEQPQADGSIIIKLKRQYINYAPGDYMKQEASI